jgi:hypothetical protein
MFGFGLLKMIAAAFAGGGQAFLARIRVGRKGVNRGLLGGEFAGWG